MNNKKSYLLAGASSSIAKQCATILKSEGNRVIGISRSEDTKEEYDEFFKVKGYGKNDFPLINEPLHGLVYFPGTITLKPFGKLSGDDFSADFQINTLGALYFTQNYLNNLKSSDGGAVVFVSSVAVKTGIPFHVSVAMSKGALEGIVPSLAAELSPKIRVNAVAPSLTDSRISERFLNSPEKKSAALQRNPMKKIGTPEEVAHAVCFLLSSRSSWITGQVLAIDGGMNNLKL